MVDQGFEPRESSSSICEFNHLTLLEEKISVYVGYLLSGIWLPRGSSGGAAHWSQDTDQAVPLLRVNDWLLRINDVDLINKDKKQAIKALLNGEGAINMVVRRRKSLGGKVVTPLHINLSGQKGRGQQKWAEYLRWQGVSLLFRG